MAEWRAATTTSCGSWCPKSRARPTDRLRRFVSGLRRDRTPEGKPLLFPFAFSALSTRLRITRDGTVEALDGFDLGRGGEPFGGYAYLATVFILAPADLNRLAEELHALLAALPAFASASAPAPGLVTARILANEAPSLYLALNGTRGVARAGTQGSDQLLPATAYAPSAEVGEATRRVGKRRGGEPGARP